MSEKRLVFPCGAYFPVKHGDEILDAAHRAKDGAYQIGVYPSSQPHVTDATIKAVKDRWRFDLKGKSAPCLGVCPNRSRRKEERGYDEMGRLGVYVSCHARLFESVDSDLDGWVMNDITPPRPAKCPHCEEQRAYVQACRRAAKHHEEAPDRTKWRKCPQCEQYRETYEETGMCAGCHSRRCLPMPNKRKCSLCWQYKIGQGEVHDPRCMACEGTGFRTEEVLSILRRYGTLSVL